MNQDENIASDEEVVVESELEASPEKVWRALTIPEAGGDTQWANGETAYEGLPEVLRQLVNNLWATHTNL